MTAIDGWLEGLMGGASLTVILLISLALGLRHATDPDHLAAVTTLIASEPDRGRATREAGLMGLSWGLGHGTMLVLLGLPLVLLGQFIPEPIQQVAEAAIGGVIVVLAARLIVRWLRGVFHVHEHEHDGSVHRHVHSHARGASHNHAHQPRPRTRLSAYGIGLLHGIGGSGGLTLLLLSTIPNKEEAAIALGLFAVGTAISMAVLSTSFGMIIAGGSVERHFERVAPVLGTLGIAFGVWYAFGALGIMTYPF